MQETVVRSLGWEDPLEEGMEIHSSILAWRIPMDCSPPGSYGIVYPRQEHRSGLPFPPPGEIPNYLFLIYSNFFPKMYVYLGYPGDSGSKESTGNVGNLGSIPELGRSPGGGHGNPLQYSCLENPMDREA